MFVLLFIRRNCSYQPSITIPLKQQNNPYESDKALWLAFKKGNHKAFNLLFSLYYEDLYFYGLKLVGKPELIQDELQEFFSDLWNKKERLGDVNYVKSYLIKSFRRRLFRANEKALKIQRSTEYNEDIKDFSLSHEDFLIAKESDNERSLRLKSAIALLNANQKEIIFLKFYNNLEYKEIAEILDIRYQSVRNSIYNAMKKLKEELEK